MDHLHARAEAGPFALARLVARPAVVLFVALTLALVFAFTRLTLALLLPLAAVVVDPRAWRRWRCRDRGQHVARHGGCGPGAVGIGGLHRDRRASACRGVGVVDAGGRACARCGDSGHTAVAPVDAPLGDGVGAGVGGRQRDGDRGACAHEGRGHDADHRRHVEHVDREADCRRGRPLRIDHMRGEAAGGRAVGSQPAHGAVGIDGCAGGGLVEHVGDGVAIGVGRGQVHRVGAAFGDLGVGHRCQHRRVIDRGDGESDGDDLALQQAVARAVAEAVGPAVVQRWRVGHGAVGVQHRGAVQRAADQQHRQGVLVRVAVVGQHIDHHRLVARRRRAVGLRDGSLVRQRGVGGQHLAGQHRGAPGAVLVGGLHGDGGVRQRGGVGVAGVGGGAWQRRLRAVAPVDQPLLQRVLAGVRGQQGDAESVAGTDRRRHLHRECRRHVDDIHGEAAGR